jgi:hypothetical protein
MCTYANARSLHASKPTVMTNAVLYLRNRTRQRNVKNTSPRLRLEAVTSSVYAGRGVNAGVARTRTTHGNHYRGTHSCFDG